MSDIKYVYTFGVGETLGHAGMKDLLGGKGANLAEMTRLGLPVPPGFTVTTEACREYYRLGGRLPDGLVEQVQDAMTQIEHVLGRKFGDTQSPLLVSVRSGSAVSMPGMMDTILNLGLNSETVQGLVKRSNNPRFAYDSYRRFIQMYAEVVSGVRAELLDQIFDGRKQQERVVEDQELSSSALKDICDSFKDQYWRSTATSFPEDPQEQLWGAIGAVFKSWNNKRAREYRALYGIPESLGTAVTVQSMVFGNLGDDSATGVAFTRDPSTGERRFFGEFLVNAQGEDVVAGIRTPRSLTEHDRDPSEAQSLELEMPRSYQELVEAYQKLELHYRDMQDMEFTIEQGRLWLLQTRTGKRTAHAAIRIAVDMVHEGLIDKVTAIRRVQPSQLDQMLHPTFDPQFKQEAKNSGRFLAKGLPASPGAEVGQIVFTADAAVAWASQNKPVILVRAETSPEDIQGMASARGILTVRGGMTSHAAVVARGMGKCCVAGCSALTVDEHAKTLMVGNTILGEGETIAIDGSTGEVFLGTIATMHPQLGTHYQELMQWVDGVRQLRVRANADTPHDSKVARSFGAEGIGLCRTEHMFFSPDRILAVREMILAEDETHRRVALSRILPMQKADFKGIFRAMEGLPVTIRLLDPPLHEFLPSHQEEFDAIASATGKPVEVVQRVTESLRELNPMLGHRGCRLGVTFPEIYETQVEAIIEAACELIRDEGFSIVPEIMIPLIASARELELLREVCQNAVNRTIARMNQPIDVLIGTMIELPRAALTADEVAGHSDFFSFGTNDLTQTTLGLSRDDSARFLPLYVELGLFDNDPFAVIDPAVAQLIRMAVEKGRSKNAKLKIGICGEHGGEPKSIRICNDIGLDYVSCSPYRVPIARLAAAHAAIGTTGLAADV